MARQKNFLKKFFAGGVLALTLAAGTAQAALVFDVRIAGGGKAGSLDAGVPVPLEVWAMVTGAPGNASLEGFANGYGSLLSDNGGASGNFSAFVLDGTFIGNGSQVGVLQDLDGDGDLDIGSNATKNISDANPLLSGLNLIFARSLAGTAVTVGDASITDGQEFLLGTTAWTPSVSLGIATLNWRVPTFTSGAQVETLWQQDGGPVSSNTVGAIFGAGAPVVLTAIPEPGTWALAGLGLLGSLVWKRRRA